MSADHRGRRPPTRQGRALIVALAALLVGAVGVSLIPAVQAWAAPAVKVAGATPTPMTLSRGAYLAAAGDCAACHTAAPSAPAFGGGLPMHSPFGTIYSTNISPDPEYGIGQYSEAQFAHALRDGQRRDGSRLYPAMPYASFAALSDADVAELYAYFMKEVQPVHAAPRATRLPFPFNQRWTMYFWDAAFVRHAPFQPRPDRGAEWNRGAYLVQTLGHCGACHTPRGPAYEERGYDETASRYLGGATLDNWHAINLRGDRASGLGRVSEAELIELLRNGHGGGDAVFGAMNDVVNDSMRYLSDADVAAIAGYLKSLPAGGERASYRPAAPANAYAMVTAAHEAPGAGVYGGYCLKCHGADGAGKDARFPRLAGNPSVLAADPASLIHIVLSGGARRGPGVTAAEHMPAFAPQLSDRDIADVLTFVRQRWGNVATPVSATAVGAMRTALSGQGALISANAATARKR